MKRLNNINWNKRAKESIAHGALTNSKRPSCFVEGIYPSHISQGFKCYLTDVDGNRFIDYICGLGTNLFGYANPQIARAVTKALQTGGSVYSLASTQEVEFAEVVRELFPFIERVRYLKSGSEGCSAAVRIARTYTGRKRVYQQGYSGWHDQFISLVPPAKGIIDDFHIEKLIEEIKEPDEVAAVILEPIITDLSKPRIQYLQLLREICDAHGIVLIFDETITALRFPEFCASNYLNIYPDLWIGGKAIAGGLPLSVVGGKKEIMNADYFVSSTWAGDRCAIAAALEANQLIHGEFRPEDLWVLGQEFKDKFNMIDKKVQIEGYATRGIFKYENEQFKALFMQEMCKAGVLIGPTWFYNKHLHLEIDNVLSIAKATINRINEGYIDLEGGYPKSPFAEKVRGNA